MPHPELATWLILATATLAIIIRPWRLPEALWAVTAAACLVAVGFLPPAAAWRGIRAGTDVYCFLAGMMLLAEIARLHGVFDWLAAGAARAKLVRAGPLAKSRLPGVIGFRQSGQGTP